MKYEAVMVKYYEVIDCETGLTVEKYNSAAEADAVADILNRSPDQVADGEPSVAQDTDSTETMVEDMAKRMEEIQSEPQWMTNDRERDTLVENGFHSMSKPVGYGEVEVACEPLPETE